MILFLSLHPLVGPGVFPEPEWALGSRIDHSEWEAILDQWESFRLNMEPPPEPVTGALELGSWLVAHLPDGMNKSCLEEILKQLKELRRLQKEITQENGSDIGRCGTSVPTFDEGCPTRLPGRTA